VVNKLLSKTNHRGTEKSVRKPTFRAKLATTSAATTVRSDKAGRFSLAWLPSRLTMLAELEAESFPITERTDAHPGP